MSRNSRVEFGEREYIREGPRRGAVREYDEVDIRVREREQDRLPAFMREDNRRAEPGQMVLRQREVETIERERPRPRSPSPVRIRERIVQRARSVSPGPGRMDEEVRFRRVVREQSRGPAERIRFVSPPSRSPSPEVQQRIRIVEREKERSPSPAPPPRPPTPKIIKGPTIEREVITHYRDIDHGMIQVRPPSPPPAPRQKHQHRDTEIDIYTSRNETEVDIHRRAHSHHRGRSPSRERKSHRPAPQQQQQIWDDEVVVQSGRKHLEVDIERRRSVSRGRRAQSAAPPSSKPAYDDEAYEITSKIDKRGRMGEAWNGITKDWAIIDVPPGTERVRMDGAGGASAEVTWQKYSGVRRAKFIPEREREEKSSVASASTSVSELRASGGGERERRLSVQIVDKDRGGSREREVEVEKVTDRRIAIRGQTPPPPPRRTETWTEITKDLVCREAIQELGYEFEETEFFYYVVEYLAYEDVLRLVQLSDRIRAARKERAREIAYEREWRDDWEIRSSHHHHHGGSGHGRRRSSHRYSVDFVDDERVVEREVVYDSRKGYRH